jgi:hypothetical protein
MNKKETDGRDFDASRCSTLRPLTEFQKAILWAVEKGVNQMACTWTIAQVAFPEKWVKRSGRGALVGHIVTAAMKMPDLVGVLPAKDKFGTPIIFKRRNA